MPSIHVCSLSRMEGIVARSGASHLVSLLDEDTPVFRPPGIERSRHLHLEFHDLAEPTPGMRLPSATDMERLIDFIRGWDRARPLVIHCYAGISRSTASAFVALCALDAARDENRTAATLRAKSPTAFPNPLMVRLADDLLGRSGRMTAAIASLSPPLSGIQTEPFALSIRD